MPNFPPSSKEEKAPLRKNLKMSSNNIVHVSHYAVQKKSKY
jgi:hypothetical protein